MSTLSQKSRNSAPTMGTVAPTVGRLWVGVLVVIAGLSLSARGNARAMDIPGLSEIQPEMAAAHPELVKRRGALLTERKTLLDRTNRHNASCSDVKTGSAADARCAKALSALTAAINSHVRASKQYNDDHLAVVNLANSQTSTDGAGAPVVDPRSEPAGLGGTSGATRAIAAPNQTKPASTPPINDPRVVDARHVPSGLPKALDGAVASAYADAPPGVSDRVRKGFQAVMDRDWNVAKAWFEDALHRDPGNADLRRLVALVAPKPEGKQPAISPRRETAPTRHTFASIAANADKMSTEEILKALDEATDQYMQEEYHRNPTLP